MKTDHDYSEGAIVQLLTFWSRNGLRGALVPAESALGVSFFALVGACSGVV